MRCAVLMRPTCEKAWGKLPSWRCSSGRYSSARIALAVRWVLDTPGVSVALWGVRHPEELAPLEEVMRFRLDDEARAYVEAVVAETVHDPVGPEFMAPPERPTGAPGHAGA